MTDLKRLKDDLLNGMTALKSHLVAEMDTAIAEVAMRLDTEIAADAPDPGPDPVPPPPPVDPIPDPAPTPIPPPPATPIPPVPFDLRAFLDGLWTRDTPNGVMDRSKLQVVGEDPLPKGATFTATSVILTGGVTFERWDIGNRGIHIKGRASLSKVYSEGLKGQKFGGPLYPIQIGKAGDLEWAEFVEMHGMYGKIGGPSKVLAAQSSAPGTALQHGLLRMMRRCRFEGFPQDHTFTYGVPGAEQIIEECYFGPQWAVPGTAPHSDVATTGGLAGTSRWRRNFIDHGYNVGGINIGINNIWRVLGNGVDKYNRDDLAWDAFVAEENLCIYPSENSSFPVDIGPNGQKNWVKPRIEFIGNLMMPGKSGEIFYQKNGVDKRVHVTAFDGNRHAVTGAPLTLY